MARAKKKSVVSAKTKSTVSDDVYGEMKKGWPKSHRPRTSPGRKKRRTKG